MTATQHGIVDPSGPAEAADPAALAADPIALAAETRRALGRGVEHLLSLQHADGHWRAELEGDSILQSEYLLMKFILGQEDDPRLPRIAAYLRRQQTAGGSWVQYPGGKIDLSATVKGYFALKLMGDDPEAPHMRRAREQVLAHGGAELCNSFTKFYLAALGQISYSAVPSIPPEIMFLPRWFYFHIDKVAAWTRTMIITLSLVVTHRPVRQIPPERSIDELYKSESARHRLRMTNDRPHRFWTPFFLTADRALKLVDKLGMTPWRKAAIKRMERWVLEHLDRSEGLGAIFPPMVYLQIAFSALGYPDDHPVLVKAREGLDAFMIEDPETGEIRIQPCFSPVWDTGIAAYALSHAGLTGEHEAMRRCAAWLRGKECRHPADYQANLRASIEPSGWFFEYENGFYPDVDDTVMVAMALKRIGDDASVAAAKRGVDWALALQNDDGGFAAFDRTKDRPILEYVPFADHNAMQDPSCPDITGRTLECLGHHGMRHDHPAIARAIAYIRSKQEPDGPWFGRWGVNYIYGTWQVVGGLQRVGYDMSAEWVQRAGQWLKDHQQDDGGFGESADTYEDPSLRGTGPATASQTAWAVMSLLSIYGPGDPAVRRGIAWLVRTQLDSGTWDEPWFTGTGFPRVFYLRYHLYRLYFPVMALGRWVRAAEAEAETA